MTQREKKSRTTSRHRTADPGAARARRSPQGARRAAPTVRVPSECTLAAADTLKLTLMKVLKTVSAVTLDVRSVRRIDTASMQLLAAFIRERRLNQLAVKAKGPSLAFDEATRLLGLSNLLAGTETIPESN